MAEKRWHEGYQVDRFEFEGRLARVVHPKEGTALGRLAIKTEYWNAFPMGMQIPLLEAGFHLCYIENENRWGTDTVLDLQERFLEHVTKTYGLSPRVVPVGMSCGGLIAIKLAAKYPQRIACLYLDNPVLNYMSCPCGFGAGEILDEGDAVPEILNALGYESISQLICCRDMPMDKLPVLVENRIPAVLAAGLQDSIAPYEENGVLLQRAYEAAGVALLTCLKPEGGHHPHGLEDPAPAVEFILQHCG